MATDIQPTPDDTTGQTDTDVDEQQTAAGDTAQTDDHDTDDQGNPNREAARYRVERNEAREQLATMAQERDEAREQVAALLQSIVDGIATASGLLDPSLLTREGYPVDDLLDDHGVPDEAKVRQACAAIREKHGIGTKRVPAPNPQQASFGGPARLPASEAFSQAFSPSR